MQKIVPLYPCFIRVNLWLEIRFFLIRARQLCKSPGFTFLAVIRLGIGLNTAIFSLINGLQPRACGALNFLHVKKPA